jgi:hypothetical protein
MSPDYDDHHAVHVITRCSSNLDAGCQLLQTEYTTSVVPESNIKAVATCHGGTNNAAIAVMACLQISAECVGG